MTRATPPQKEKLRSFAEVKAWFQTNDPVRARALLRRIAALRAHGALRICCASARPRAQAFAATLSASDPAAKPKANKGTKGIKKRAAAGDAAAAGPLRKSARAHGAPASYAEDFVLSDDDDAAAMEGDC